MKSSIQRLSTVASIAGAVTTAAHAQQAVQWRVEDGGNGHWYLLIPESHQWTAANARAMAIGGHLATLTTQAEAMFAVPHGGLGAWLGGLAPANQGCSTAAWRWITGEPWTFSHWAPGEPGNCGEIGLAFAAWGGYSGRWNNTYLHDTPPGLFVEWDADCNDDGTVDYGQIRAGLVVDRNGNNVPDSCECAATPSLPICCSCDVFRDNAVNGIDLGVLLGQWGEVTQYTVTDFNGDGAVDGLDLGTLLAAWGPCPG